MLKPKLPSQAGTAVGLVHDFDQFWLLPGEVIGNPSSLVGGTIIDDKNLYWTVGLSDDTLHSLNK